MAVVTTTFSSAANDKWATSTWAATDPSWKLDVELTNWVNAINDATKISIIHDPGDATARGTSDEVRWLLRCRESDTSSDYGFSFCTQLAGGGQSSNCGTYYARTAGSGNNGAGTYNTIVSSSGAATAQSLSQAHSYLTAYDAEGANPWFAFSSYAGGLASLNMLIRLSTANMAAGSYYPATGLGKWIYITAASASFSSSTLPEIFCPQRSTAAPYIGINGPSRLLRAPRPYATVGDGYFFKLGAQYGDAHFLGEPTYDMLISNTTTGAFNDTVVLESKTYTRVYGGIWIRTA